MAIEPEPTVKNPEANITARTVFFVQRQAAAIYRDEFEIIPEKDLSHLASPDLISAADNYVALGLIMASTQAIPAGFLEARQAFVEAWRNHATIDLVEACKKV